MTYERDQIVLVKFKHGAKLAKIVSHEAYPTYYSVRIWNATAKTWTGVTVRRPDLIMGIASASDQRTYGMPVTP